MKKSSFLPLVIFLIGLIIFGGVTAIGEDLNGEVDIAGSSTVYPISVAMAEEFSRAHRNVIIPVKSTGTGGGFQNFFTVGKSDINNASRRIKESELQKARENGIEPIEFKIAYDAITVAVNPGADWINNITVKELAKIWRPNNHAKKWSDLNPDWPEKEITLYGPTSASGTFDYFTKHVVGEEGASRADYHKTERDNTIVQAISGNKYAIGYFGMAYYLRNKNRLKALKIEGVAPTLENAKSGKYTPLSRPLFIYVNKNSLQREAVSKFVKFYLEKSDSSIISQIGYVPLSKEENEKNIEKLENIIEELS